MVGVVAGLNLCLYALFFFLPAGVFWAEGGKSSGVAGMIVGDAWDSSWTLDDLLGVAGANNHLIVVIIQYHFEDWDT